MYLNQRFTQHTKRYAHCIIEDKRNIFLCIFKNTIPTYPNRLIEDNLRSVMYLRDILSRWLKTTLDRAMTENVKFQVDFDTSTEKIQHMKNDIGS